MEFTKKIDEVRKFVRQWKKEGLSVGFVPTMGYLHDGHKSLIEKAVKDNDKVVVSIFVNPMQFGENEDFNDYPRDIEHDKKICFDAKADLIFNPDASEMYGDNFYTFVDMNIITKGLCGKSRPIHFRGVCTVVSKLFNIVNPDKAYFGQKDAQQLAVIKKMTEDLNMNIDIIGCPIIREDDGLAKSSRNVYLNNEDRKAATVLNKSLNIGKISINEGEKSVEKVKKIIENEILKEKNTKIDYVEIVKWPNLEPIDVIEKPILAAIAVYIGKTRLIDNFILE